MPKTVGFTASHIDPGDVAKDALIVSIGFLQDILAFCIYLYCRIDGE